MSNTGPSSSVTQNFTPVYAAYTAGGVLQSLVAAGGVTVNIPIVLAQSAVAASVTGTLAETTLATITIPGGVMGRNGALRVTPLFSCTNNANAKLFNVKLGATAFLNAGVTASSVMQPLVIVRNRGAANSQVTFPSASNLGLGAGSVAVTTGAIDTSVDQTLTITGTLANIADTITLEGYTIEILPS